MCPDMQGSGNRIGDPPKQRSTCEPLKRLKDGRSGCEVEPVVTAGSVDCWHLRRGIPRTMDHGALSRVTLTGVAAS